MTTEELLNSTKEVKHLDVQEHKEAPESCNKENAKPELETTKDLTSEDKNQKDVPVAIYGTYLLFFIGAVTGGILSLLGIISSHVCKNGSSELDASHCRYMQRTFYFTIMWSIAAVLGMFATFLPYLMSENPVEDITMVLLEAALTGTSTPMVIYSLITLFLVVVIFWHMYRIIKGAIWYSKKKKMYS